MKRSLLVLAGLIAIVASGCTAQSHTQAAETSPAAAAKPACCDQDKTDAYCGETGSCCEEGKTDG